MAILRDAPYGNQHFRVDLGTADAGPAAGFSHIVLPDISVDVIQYRTGNDKESGVHKLPGLAHYGDVILRRGIIGSLDLYSWINQIRNGDANARRTVTISLLSEDLSNVVLTWKLLRALARKVQLRRPERQRHRCSHRRTSPRLRAPGSGMRITRRGRGDL